jgi:hypothetical protein
MGNVIVLPLSHKQAVKICQEHPHASAVPKSAKYYFGGYIDGRLCGVAIWGWGIQPRKTPQHLFSDNVTGIANYLELCRFFVYDWCPPCTASAFLCATHRIIKRHCPQIDYLYTYAAGFQGLVGIIYQASNYKYIGRKLCKMTYLPNMGLVHDMTLWHRYNTHSLSFVRTIYPDAKLWLGYNFCYIYFPCSQERQAELMRHAKFTICEYPDEQDVMIWLEDENGTKEKIDVAFAKKVPLVNLKTRGRGVNSSTSGNHLEGGGAMPTRPLQLLEGARA